MINIFQLTCSSVATDTSKLTQRELALPRVARNTEVSKSDVAIRAISGPVQVTSNVILANDAFKTSGLSLSDRITHMAHQQSPLIPPR
jgi:hypothetical protein